MRSKSPARRSGVRKSAPVAPAYVLVADDDEAVRAALRVVLEEDGYAVVEAATGAEALELLAAAADGRAPTPDVVVLDVCMPELSGLGVLRLMQRIDHAPPTLIVTAFRDRSVEVVARNFGATCVLHKPLDLDDVRRAVVATALHRSDDARRIR